MKLNAIIKVLASLKLTIILLFIIVAVCVVGTLLAYEYALEQIFLSFWFLSLLVLLAINLLACAVDSWQRGTGFNSVLFVHISILVIMFGGVVGRMYGVKGKLLLYEQQSSNSFLDKSKLTKTFAQFDSDRNSLWDDREISRWQKQFAGGEWNLRHHDANKDFYIAFEEWSHAMANAPKVIKEQVCFVLPFTIHLHEFITERHPPAARLHVSVRGTRIEQNFNIAPNAVYRIPWTAYRLHIANYPQTTPAPQQLPITVWQDDDRQTAKLALAGHGNSQRLFWNKLHVVYYIEQQGQVKSWKSVVEIRENDKVVKQATIAVNHPLMYKGFKFYQASYFFNPHTRKMRTDLAAVKDPGVPLIYAGFIMLSLGLLWKFCLRPFMSRSKI